MPNSFPARYRAAMRHAGGVPDRSRGIRPAGRPRMRPRPATRRPHPQVRLLGAGGRERDPAPRRAADGTDGRRAPRCVRSTTWLTPRTAARSATAPPRSPASS